MKTTLYIVRHCEARGNVDRIFQGHTDADISEKGKAQLERLAERFRDIPLDAVYSSPLKRARLTADAINRYHGLPVHIHPGLIEIHGGYMEGKPWADFPVTNPEDARRWNLEPWLFAPQGGESMQAVYDRIWRAVGDIVTAEEGGAVAVASHGCAIRNLLCRAKGWPIQRLAEVAWCDNTGVSILEFDGPDKCRVVLENDISHLDEGLSTLAGQKWWRKENLASLNFTE